MVNNLSNFYHEVDHSISLDKKNWMHLLLIYPNSLPLEHEFLGLKASTKIKKKKSWLVKVQAQLLFDIKHQGDSNHLTKMQEIIQSWGAEGGNLYVYNIHVYG